MPPNLRGPMSTLFHRLLLFGPALEKSLQRGPIWFGFSKQRSLFQTHIAVLFVYLWNLCWAASVNQTGRFRLPITIAESEKAAKSKLKPIAVETFELSEQIRVASLSLPAPYLRRERIDMQQLYYATTESYVSSFVFVNAVISIVSGITFTIGNIGSAVEESAWSDRLSMGAAFASGLIGPIAPLLASYYLSKKLRLLLFCIWTLTRKLTKLQGEEGHAFVRHIRWIACQQIIVSTIRLMSSLGVAFALPWSLAARRGLYSYEAHPLVLAVFSASLALLAGVGQFLVFYSVLYSLDAKLGEKTCSAFSDEFVKLKAELSIPHSSMKTKHAQERTTWEYVARDFLNTYRFDVIFGADRFGTILQQIQNGLVKADVDVSESANEVSRRTKARQLKAKYRGA